MKININFLLENEFEEEFKKILLNMYGNNNLEEYLLKRYIVVNKISNIKKVKLVNFSKFLLSELGIIINKDCFLYKNKKFYIDNPCKQSVCNILLNNDFYQQIFNHLFINNVLLNTINKDCFNIIQLGKNKTKKIKPKYKKYLYIKSVLDILNKEYKISINVPVIPLYIQPQIPILTLEEKANIELYDMTYSTNDNSVILEKNIRDYIYSNLKIYIPDAISWKKEVNIGNGCILDILVHCQNTDIIIELKNKTDDRLLWQTISYYNTYCNKYKKDVKVYTIAPIYKNGMIDELKKQQYITVYQYNLKIEKNKITNLKIFQI